MDWWYIEPAAEAFCLTRRQNHEDRAGKHWLYLPSERTIVSFACMHSGFSAEEEPLTRISQNNQSMTSPTFPSLDLRSYAERRLKGKGAAYFLIKAPQGIVSHKIRPSHLTLMPCAAHSTKGSAGSALPISAVQPLPPVVA